MIPSSRAANAIWWHGGDSRPSRRRNALELRPNVCRLHARPVVVLDALLPVFLIIALGAVLTKTGWLAPDLLRGLTRLAYWVGLPCLLFESVGQTQEFTNRPLRLFGVLLAATLITGVLAWIVARALRLPRTATGTFVQGAFRGNLAMLALPVVVSAFGAETVPDVALAIAPLMIIYNLVAAAALLASQHGNDRTSLQKFTVQLMLNPLVLAILAGLLAAQVGLTLPRFLDHTLHLLGAFAIPIALFGIGGTLVLSPVRTHLRATVAATALKVVFAPLAGIALARMLHFPAEDIQLIGVLLAAPTAAMSFVLAAQMKGDAALASSMVVFSTLASAAALGLVLAVF